MARTHVPGLRVGPRSAPRARRPLPSPSELAAAMPSHSLGSRRLLLLWTRTGCRRDPFETLRLALEAGVDLVQIREKHATAREVAQLARALREPTRRFGVPLLVNDRCDVAIASEADGVHLGQDDLDPRDARRMLGPSLVIGVSTHSIADVRSASAAGADLLGFGPMFATSTKPGEPVIGPQDLPTAVSASRCPVFAIGGLDANRIRTIGAARAAVSSAILAAPDPIEATRTIRAALDANASDQRINMASP